MPDENIISKRFIERITASYYGRAEKSRLT